MKRSPEIEAVVSRFMSARAAGDITIVRSLFSDSAELRLIGSDEDEWAQGDMVVALMGAHWEAIPVTDDTVLRSEAFENGETGWAAVEARRHSVEREFVFRITFVLTLDEGSWKFVQIHISVPVANEQVSGVELSRTLADLLAALNAGSFPDTPGDRASETWTIAFTDIVGSTAVSRSMGDVAWSQTIGDHFILLSGIVEGQNGQVVKTLGDGGMFAFSSASAALSAVEEIQRQMEGSVMSVRIGVHSGDVVRDHDDYLGLTVNKAARVAAAAEGGQILVSSTTVGMVSPSEFSFGDPITVELKGLDGRHQLQPLIWS